MSTKKIAINGFGRIGRLAARIIVESYPEIEIVAVNDLTSVENLAYLFEYDSTYRRLNYKVSVQRSDIIIHKLDQQVRIKVLSQKDPAQLPWKDLGVDVVLECTGRFLTKELASLHLQSGVKRVILSAPAKEEEIATVVLGVNDISTDQIVSNASCTTNSMAPALKVLEDNYGIEQAIGITAHAYTATQVLQDAPSKKALRDGRAAAVNMIPSKTGAAKAVYRVLPNLKGKISLSALRVPVITGSMVYLTAILKKSVDSETINKVFSHASENSMKGILEYSEESLVSSDVIQNPHSTILDSSLTETVGNQVKLVLWYDNEWGYANRLVEVVQNS
ncbi:MAG: type I glyceraldehyde-3-phosphate dehydrogenase [Patescibacteria group bacterium]